MHLAALEPGVTLLEQFLPAGEQRRSGALRRAGVRPGADVHPDGARRPEDERRHAVPGPALERAYLRIRADPKRLRPSAGASSWRLRDACSEAAARAGFDMQPDLCIMNFYDAGSRMGVHQDKDERRETIEAGVPIVSVSLGDTARFVLGA